MSTLHDRIKADYLNARKAKSPMVGPLSALLGEITTKEKTFSPARSIHEDEVVAIVRKMLKSVEETLVALRARLQARHDDVEKAEAERVMLEAYLPQQMSEADLEAFAQAAKLSGMNMGAIMGALKAERPGQYDGKLASAVVKRVLG